MKCPLLTQDKQQFGRYFGKLSTGLNLLQDLSRYLSESGQSAGGKTFIYAPNENRGAILQKSIKHLSLLVVFRQTMFQVKPLLSEKT